MRRLAIAVICMAALSALGVAVARGQGGGAAPAAAAAPAAPKDKAGYWPHGDIENIWKGLEAKGVVNQRVADGGAFSINIRIVKEGDAPLVHATSADVWVVQEGTATSVTGGQLVDGQKRPNADDIAGKSITGGTERALKAGDILFVPQGVPHGFKNIKGFRAYLIRFDTK